MRISFSVSGAYPLEGATKSSPSTPVSPGNASSTGSGLRTICAADIPSTGNTPAGSTGKGLKNTTGWSKTTAPGPAIRRSRESGSRAVVETSATT